MSSRKSLYSEKTYLDLFIDGKRIEDAYVKCTALQTQIKYEGYFLYPINPSTVTLTYKQETGNSDKNARQEPNELVLSDVAKTMDEQSVFEVIVKAGRVTVKQRVFD